MPEEEAEAVATKGFSTRDFFGEAGPEDERDRLIVVEVGGDDGPSRGKGGERSRRELLGSDIVVFGPREGDWARRFGGGISGRSLLGASLEVHSI